MPSCRTATRNTPCTRDANTLVRHAREIPARRLLFKALKTLTDKAPEWGKKGPMPKRRNCQRCSRPCALCGRTERIGAPAIYDQIRSELNGVLSERRLPSGSRWATGVCSEYVDRAPVGLRVGILAPGLDSRWIAGLKRPARRVRSISLIRSRWVHRYHYQPKDTEKRSCYLFSG